MTGLRSEHGQGLAEYIIIVIVIAVAVIFGIRFFGGSIGGQFENATRQVEDLQETAGVLRSTDGNSNSGASTSSSSEAGTRFSESGGGSSGGGGSGSESSSGDSGIAALKDEGVGGEEYDPVKEIDVNWGTVGFITGLVCLIGVVIVFLQRKDKSGSGKGKSKKKKKRFSLGGRGGQEGQAMVEFLFSAITFLFVILGVIQLAMVLNAYSLVRYAAYNAARAATVYADDSDVMDDRMHEAARLSLLPVFPRHGRADHLRGYMENYEAARLTDSSGFLTYFNEPITEVKVIENRSLESGSVITFDDFTEGADAVVTVQVRHLYELVIPLVNRILFFVYTKFRSGEGYQGETLDNLARDTNIRRRSGDFQDIEYRIPLVAHYTMRLQTDYSVP